MRVFCSQGLGIRDFIFKCTTTCRKARVFEMSLQDMEFVIIIKLFVNEAQLVDRAV